MSKFNPREREELAPPSKPKTAKDWARLHRKGLLTALGLIVLLGGLWGWQTWSRRQASIERRCETVVRDGQKQIECRSATESGNFGSRLGLDRLSR